MVWNSFPLSFSLLPSSISEKDISVGIASPRPSTRPRRRRLRLQLLVWAPLQLLLGSWGGWVGWFPRFGLYERMDGWMEEYFFYLQQLSRLSNIFRRLLNFKYRPTWFMLDVDIAPDLSNSPPTFIRIHTIRRGAISFRLNTWNHRRRYYFRATRNHSSIRPCINRQLTDMKCQCCNDADIYLWRAFHLYISFSFRFVCCLFSFFPRW